MCSLMHVKAIGTKKSEILAKITFLGIFGQILPKTPIVHLPPQPKSMEQMVYEISKSLCYDFYTLLGK